MRLQNCTCNVRDRIIEYWQMPWRTHPVLFGQDINRVLLRVGSNDVLIVASHEVLFWEKLQVCADLVLADGVERAVTTHVQKLHAVFTVAILSQLVASLRFLVISASVPVTFDAAPRMHLPVSVHPANAIITFVHYATTLSKAQIAASKWTEKMYNKPVMAVGELTQHFWRQRGKPGETPISMQPCRESKRVLPEHKFWTSPFDRKSSSTLCW